MNCSIQLWKIIRLSNIRSTQIKHNTSTRAPEQQTTSFSLLPKKIQRLALNCHKQFSSSLYQKCTISLMHCTHLLKLDLHIPHYAVASRWGNKKSFMPSLQFRRVLSKSELQFVMIGTYWRTWIPCEPRLYSTNHTLFDFILQITSIFPRVQTPKSPQISNQLGACKHIHNTMYQNNWTVFLASHIPPNSFWKNK